MIAASHQTAVVIVVIVIAAIMLIRQVYRLMTGKVTKCSCCSQICSTRGKDPGQCSADNETTEPTEEKSEKE